MSSFLLRFLIMILRAEVLYTELEVSVDTVSDAYVESKGVYGKIIVRNLPILGGHPPSS